MTFKILIGDKFNVDFNSPINMTNKECHEFIKLLKTTFDPSVVIEENVNELRDWRMADEDRIQYPRTWTPEEYKVLLNSRSVDEAENKLGRSGMSILVQDGFWRPQFFNWCKDNNKNPFSENVLDLIKQFMKEKEELIKAKREKKKRLRIIDKKMLELKNELITWDSEEKRRELEFFKNMGEIKDIQEFINNKKDGIKKEIAKLEKEDITE